MTVRHSLLALLAERPAHGYGLKSAFEGRTAGTWPLNVGQVYTTLSRLERDGLVECEGLVESEGAQAATGPRQSWRITEQGQHALASWYATPVVDDPPSRDELSIKVLLAVAADAVDVTAILQRQRSATMERLQDFTRHKRDADPDTELPWLLLLDSLILKAEAEIRWLDLCEERLAARSSS